MNNISRNEDVLFHTCDKYVDLIKKLAKKNVVTLCKIKQ